MKYLIYIVNIILAFVILRYEYFSRNDKTIIITSALIFGLLAVNLIVGVALRLDRKESYKYFFQSALIVIVIVSLSFIL